MKSLAECIGKELNKMSSNEVMDYKPWEKPALEGLRGVIGKAIKYPFLDYKPEIKDGVFFTLKDYRNIMERELEMMEDAIEQGNPLTPFDEKIVQLQRGLMKMGWDEFIKATNELGELRMKRSRYIERHAKSGIIDDHCLEQPKIG